MATKEQTPATARVRALFQQLGKQHAPNTGPANGVLEFDIEDAGSWHMMIERGMVAVAEGSVTKPDCVITTDQDDFVRIVRGDDNLVAAMLRGSVRMSGDLDLAMTFRRLIPIHS